jgi:hypothetical protein
MTDIKDELRICEGLEGYSAIDGIFEKYNLGNKPPKEKTQVLYDIMGVVGGWGTPGLTDEDNYNLAKDLLASRDWKRFARD